MIDELYISDFFVFVSSISILSLASLIVGKCDSANYIANIFLNLCLSGIFMQIAFTVGCYVTKEKEPSFVHAQLNVFSYECSYVIECSMHTL